MSERRPKLSFIPKQARIRCEFDRQYCIDHPDGAEEIIERAKQRMRVEKAESRIAFYRIFATRLRTMWKLMSESTESPTTTVAVTVASGAPDLPGLKFEPQNNDAKILGHLTITSDPQVVQTWQSYFLKLTIGKLIRDADIAEIADPAQIHRLWLHACAGHPVVHVPIQAMPKLANCSTESPYKLIEDSSHQDVSLIICDVHRMMEKSNLDEMTRRLSNFRDRMNSKGFNYQIQFEDLIRSIRSAARGPERYGLDLPIVILAAYDKNRIQVSAQSSTQVEPSVRRQPALPAIAKATGQSPKLSNSDLGAKFNGLQINISADSGTARIGQFDPAWYDKNAAAISVDSIIAVAQQAGVVHGISAEIRKKLEDNIRSKLNLAGFVIAEATAMTPGAEPYLHRSFEDSLAESANDANISIRDRQRRGFVKRGQTICELRFKSPSADGINVRGERLLAPLPTLENISCGEGVSLVGARFVAQFDGTPTVTDTSVSLVKGLVHQGNVDLSSGNIEFNGDVTITGNIDPGAVVRVSGDLLVEGSIQGGEVRVDGKLTVAGGISGCTGRGVFAAGDLSAGFFENSKVRSRGNIMVNKSILTSEVHAGGVVEVEAKEGLILGSKIYAEIGLVAEHFGRPNAAVTEAFLGCSHRDERSYQIRLSRHKKLTEHKQHTDLKYKELKSRPDQQKTQRHRQEESQLEVYVKRLDKILVASLDKLSDAKERVRPNKEAYAEIREVLAPGSRFTIAGKRFTVRDAVAGVRVHLKSGAVKIDALDDSAKSNETKKAS